MNKLKNKNKSKNANKYLTKVFSNKKQTKNKDTNTDKKEAKTKKKKLKIENDEADKNVEKNPTRSIVRILNNSKNNKVRVNIPWTEKYRPSKLENVKSQKSINILENALKTGELPNLLIYGNPGTGKTTSVLALCKQLFGPIKYKERVLELNASDERGIGVVRDKIIKFSKLFVGNGVSDYLCPPFKVIILDEADEITKDGQSALRKVMEDNLSITRFIFICNYSKHILDPINSRCVKIRFNPINKNDAKRTLIDISKKENLKIDKSAIKTIVKYTNGDLRKSILMLQNLRYVSTDNKNISEEHVNELCKYITQSEFDEIVDEIRNEKNKNNIKFVIDKVEHILDKGHVFESIIEKVIEYIIDFETNDLTKQKLLFKFSDIDKKINGRASEYIQLLDLLNSIRTLE